MMLVLEINSQYYYVDQDVRYFNTRHKIYTENESMKTISTMEIYTERLEKNLIIHCQSFQMMNQMIAQICQNLVVWSTLSLFVFRSVFFFLVPNDGPSRKGAKDEVGM